jgi:hypothetical protein
MAISAKYINIIFWILIIFSLIFSYSINEYCIGDKILNYFNLPSFSNNNNGTHYTIFYSIFLIALAFFLRIKYSSINIKICIIANIIILLYFISMMF